jgi:serine protease Do
MIASSATSPRMVLPAPSVWLPARCLSLAAVLALVSILCPASRARAADDDVSIREEDAVKAAVDRVAPSVVKIETFGGLERVGGMLVGTGPTTGLAVSADGYIVSSAFNFVQKPAQILVHLDDGSRLPAKLVATDHSRMIVLLKVTLPAGKPPLTVPVAVPRGEMAVGQWAVAVGRTFEGAKPSLSVGIISALNRIWNKAIQTDAKISPNNYGGPLVDIRGRVLGLLVPMSPMANNELAGVEWYDSGIGFAVPLADINQVLPRLEKGENLRPGLLGISMKGTDIYSGPVDIAAVQPNSPAYRTGIKPGDRVVEIDGHKVSRQAELKHLLGPHYAGDKVQVVVMRGGQRIEATVELTDKLAAYAHPFLGMLPIRPAGEAAGNFGVTVRYVYPDSPAAKAGLKPADRITEWQGKPVKAYSDLSDQFAALAPRDKATFTVHRGDETLHLDVQLATLPEAIPPDLPPAHGAPSGPVDPKLAVRVVPIKLADAKNKCLAYVPENYNPAVACGVVIWLYPPGPHKETDLLSQWKEICDKHDLILLAPESAEPTRWQREELGVVRKMLDQVTDKYHVDRTRVVAGGQEAGGAMAYLLATTNREWIHAVAAVDAAAPAGSPAPPNDPVLRMAFYIAEAEKSPAKGAIDETVTRLRAEKYPVTVHDLGSTQRGLNAAELSELARWIDSLDRL